MTDWIEHNGGPQPVGDVESCANVDDMFTLTLEPLTAKETAR
jgi:hypothetical protein